MDREKVIKGLEICTSPGTKGCVYDMYESAIECPYAHHGCRVQMENDALALLKEQGKTGHWIYKKYDDMFMCSCCKKYSIRNNYPYCHWCGAKMKGR